MIPSCPKCHSEYTYQDQHLYICPSCSHDWPIDQTTPEELKIAKDAYGHILQDGDSISVIKDLKIKGSSQTIKIGTRVKNIRIIDGDHNIDCKIDGVGAMKLKSEFVKKIS